MPVLKKHKHRDGFYIVGVIPGRNTFATWQVTTAGVDWLSKAGIAAGDDVPGRLLRTLLDQGYIFTGGSGIGTAASPVSQQPQSPWLPIQFVIEESEWELMLVLRALSKTLLGEMQSGSAAIDMLELSGFRIDHDQTLSAVRLWPGKGTTTCRVRPHQEPYVCPRPS